MCFDFCLCDPLPPPLLQPLLPPLPFYFTSVSITRIITPKWHKRRDSSSAPEASHEKCGCQLAGVVHLLLLLLPILLMYKRFITQPTNQPTNRATKLVYTTFVLDCGSVRMTLVDGDVTLFLPAPSACPRELVPISRPAWTPSAASLQNP